MENVVVNKNETNKNPNRNDEYCRRQAIGYFI